MYMKMYVVTQYISNLLILALMLELYYVGVFSYILYLHSCICTYLRISKYFIVKKKKIILGWMIAKSLFRNRKQWPICDQFTFITGQRKYNTYYIVIHHHANKNH